MASPASGSAHHQPTTAFATSPQGPQRRRGTLLAIVLSALDSGDANTHSASVRVFDREGRWISTLHPSVDLTVQNLANDARVALR